MFDIAFTELMIAAVIALIVVGPERLPKMARQIGEWAGKLQRYVNDVKSDINRQIQLDELRNLKTEVTSAARDIESTVKSTIDATRKDFDDISSSLSGSANLTDDTQDEAPAAIETDWNKVYEQRRVRERIRDRRNDRDASLGRKRPRHKH